MEEMEMDKRMWDGDETRRDDLDLTLGDRASLGLEFCCVVERRKKDGKREIRKFKYSGLDR